MEQKTREIIAQLKEIRAEKGYSCQKIYDMVEASGGYVSLTTIKRVFSDEPKTQNFRYNETIKPIATALLEINKPPEQGEGVSLMQHELDTLRMIVAYKEQTNQDLRAENNRMAADAADKQNQIMSLLEQLSRKDRAILRLSTGLIALLVLICAVLIYDISNLSTGFVRVVAGHGLLAVLGIVAALVSIAAVYVAVRRTRK